MTNEVRQYFWLRLSVLGTGLAVLASLIVASIQLWPIVQRLIEPTKLACGCAVLSVTTPWWLTTISIGVITATLTLIVWSTILFIGHLRRSRNQQLKLQLRTSEVVRHTALGVDVNIVEQNNPFALTLGFIQPKIYVSRGLVQQLSTEEYQAVLAHERAHQRAYDPLVTAVMATISTLFRWVPGAGGWMSAAYSLRELAADAVATDGYRTTDALSSAFVKLSATSVHPSLSAFSPNRDRLEKLLNHQWTLPRRWWHWSTGLIVAGIIFGSLSLGHFATAKSPTIPLSAAAACHETMIMCQIKYLPSLPPAWLCGDGRCVGRVQPWQSVYAWTTAR